MCKGPKGIGLKMCKQQLSINKTGYVIVKVTDWLIDWLIDWLTGSAQKEKDKMIILV